MGNEKMVICPKPEQMMICPVETCFRKCEAKKPHQRNVSCEMECAAGYIAPCNIIPVPSTPASEGMLKFNNALEADALDWDTRNIKSKFTSEEILGHIEVLSKSFYNKYPGKGLTPSEVMELHKSEYWESIINLILLKCHQSEAAKIKESVRIEINKMLEGSGFSIGKVYDEASTEYIVCDSDGDEIDTDSLKTLMETYMTPDDDTKSEAAIRADQNKKIATWIQKNDNHFIFHFIPECGGDFCFLATEGMENECAEPDEGAGYCQYRDKCRYANKQLLLGQDFIAKLQKGEF